MLSSPLTLIYLSFSYLSPLITCHFETPFFLPGLLNLPLFSPLNFSVHLFFLHHPFPLLLLPPRPARPLLSSHSSDHQYIPLLSVPVL